MFSLQLCELSNFCLRFSPFSSRFLMAPDSVLWFCSYSNPRSLSPLPTCSFNLSPLLQLEGHITALTASLKNSSKFHSQFSQSTFYLPLHLTIILFSSSDFLAVGSHFVLPHPFYSSHPLVARILSQMWFCFPSLSSLRHRASPAHHYLSEHPAHCPALLHFPPRTRNETGASWPLFIIFHSPFPLFCPLGDDATTYSSNSSSLWAPFRLLIRRREWFFFKSSHPLMFQELFFFSFFLRGGLLETLACVHIVCEKQRDISREVSSLRLSRCFLEQKPQGRTRIRETRGKEEKRGTSHHLDPQHL